MEESLFIQFISALWPKLNLYVSTKVNNSKKPLTYLHKSMLTPVYSVDQKWEGTSANTTYVAADMVALDSPLPVKKRDSIATSNGKLPKVGMMKKKDESDINTLNIMKAQYSMLASSSDESQKAAADSLRQRIIQRFADDAVYCSVGIDEKNEANFLTAWSEGVLAVEDADNTGTAIRIDYGYDKFPGNHFGVETKGHISRDDIERVISAANDNGVSIAKIAISLSTYRQLKKERWARELVADDKQIAYTQDSSLPVPNSDSFDSAFASEFGISFLKIDRTITFEKNGIRIPKKPFNPNRLVFYTSDDVGSLVWATLAEATNPVAGVKYTTIDDYKLIAEFSQTNPLVEMTTGQSFVLPVIENVDQIFTLDLSNALEVDETAESKDETDVSITINGKKYTKANVVSALDKMGVKLPKKPSDDVVLKGINKLSDEDEAKLMNSLSPIE